MHKDKIKKRYILKLLQDVIHTEFGVELHESSAIQFILVLPVVDGQAIDLLSYSDETYSVVGGSAQITNALGRALAGQIKLASELTEIKKQAGKYRLSFAGQATVEVDMVIVAIPFPVLNKVVLNVPLPKQLRHFIDEAKLGSNEKVLARFARRFWRQENGFTDAAWSGSGFSEVWDATQRQSTKAGWRVKLFPGRHPNT